MELRKDYLTGQWVCIAPLRSLRPGAKHPAAILTDDEAQCPFCPQNSHITPAETDSYGSARAVPNKYPALDASSENGFGFHEVVVESPDHGYTTTEGPVECLSDTLRTIQRRVAHFERDERVRAIQVFKNHGANAGASLSHAHWQLMALPFIPPVKQTMLGNFNNYQAETGRCCLCDTVRDKTKLSGLLVYETDGIVAYCPHAAMYNYGVNVTTTFHAPRFTGLEGETLAGFAAAVRHVLRAMEAVLPQLAYNICFQCAPVDHSQNGQAKHWHFFMQIIPRTWNFAGFELGTGCAINPVDPAEAAKRLRDAAR